MKNFRSLTLAVITLSAAMISFSSCERDEISRNGDSKYVTLKVSTEKSIETKAMSSNAFETIDLSENGVELFLSGYQTINTESPFVATKAGAPIVADDIKQFNIRMTDPEGKHDGTADRSNASADHWYILDASGNKLVWNEVGATANFLAYYPATAGSFDGSSNAINYNAANGQTDFVVASTNWAHDHEDYHNTETYVPLKFKHALALVKFNVQTNVTKIVINNATTAGTVALNGDTFDYTSTSTGTLELAVTGNECSFYVMPDAIGTDDLNVTFYVDNKALTTAKLGVESWDEGIIYNYTISDSNNEVVDIEIGDMDNITVENVKTSAVYLRAAVVANWFDSNDRIACALGGNDLTLSTNSNWVLGGDDYYYYKTPVIGYQASENLISALTANITKEGLTLKIGIAVQAVEYDANKTYAKAAWGAGAANLETL